jgi:hypothetical protein
VDDGLPDIYVYGAFVSCNETSGSSLNIYATFVMNER